MKNLGRKLLIILLVISIVLPDLGGQMWSSYAAAEGSIARDSDSITAEPLSEETVSTGTYDAPAVDSTPGIVQEYPDYILKGQEIDPSEAPEMETQEDRIQAIKEK
ncbi:hypothetical protein, partial [Paenibacillus camerounensis]|uniref:hypothetical protein n=1 Tax=Paenibacillus camerounensis TaxID=1243663 RepID=UPI0005AAADCE